MKIQSGDVFAFIVEQNNQYGIIQVLENGKIGGYNVRIFYYLLGNIDDKAIETTIQSADYYYINNFHPSALVRNGKRLGCFAIPEVVIPPRYMRECERKPNGDLHWYVMEDMRVVKTLKKFDEGLKSLSPAAAWGIQYIKKRWLDGFTLDNWHELEEKWYADYLKTYEPDKFLAKEKVPPFEQWAKSGRIPQKPLQEIDLLFKTFILQVSAQKNDETAVHTSIKQLIEGLNTWNVQHNFIETEEREELINYIYDVLDTYHCKDLYDAIDSLRQW